MLPKLTYIVMLVRKSDYNILALMCFVQVCRIYFSRFFSYVNMIYSMSLLECTSNVCVSFRTCFPELLFIF